MTTSNDNKDELLDELLQAAKESEEGFEQLLRYLQPKMMRWIRDYSPEDEEGIFQDISIKIYKNLNNLRPDTLYGWIKTTVDHACIDEWRKRSKRAGIDEDTGLVYVDEYEDWELPDENSMRKAQDAVTDEYRQMVLEEVYAVLPEKQRAVVIMHVKGEKTFKEIAEILGEPESTVKSRMNAARKTIGEEVVRIQKRDGTKLYNFTPFTFFLWLLRGKEDGTVPADPELCARTAQNVWNGPVAESTQAAASAATEATSTTTEAASTTTSAATTTTATEAATTSAATTAATTEAASATTANTTAAIAGAAAKGGAGIGMKIFAGVAAVALLAGGGYLMTHQDGGPSRRDIENDVVTVVTPQTTFRLSPGESIPLEIRFVSKNDIEYTAVLSVDNTSVASLEDNILTAISPGEATLTVSTIPEKEVREYKIVVTAYNGVTALEKLMQSNGYTKRYEFRPADLYYPYESLPILYDGFDKSIFDADVEAYRDLKVFLKEEMTIREAEARGFGTFVHTVTLGEYKGKIKYYSSYDPLTRYEVAFGVTSASDGSQVSLENRIYGGDNYTFKYDAATNTYSCEGNNGTMYLDFMLPFDTICSTERGWSFTYDDQCRPVQAHTPPDNWIDQSFDIQYDDAGRAVKILAYGSVPEGFIPLAPGPFNPSAASDLQIDFYYGDNGLLKGSVSSVMYEGQRLINDIVVYAYE